MLIRIIAEVCEKFFFLIVRIRSINFHFTNFSAITYESLTNQLTKHGGLLENLSISIDRWLVPVNPEASAHAKKRMNLPHQLSAPYIKNNSVYLVFVTLFILFNLFLFITRGIKFWIKTRSLLVVFARACGKPQFFVYTFISGS